MKSHVTLATWPLTWAAGFACVCHILRYGTADQEAAKVWLDIASILCGLVCLSALIKALFTAAKERIRRGLADVPEPDVFAELNGVAGKANDRSRDHTPDRTQATFARAIDLPGDF